MDPPLGTVPGTAELEVSVFGPGYGEGILIHLGDHKWLVVDSCRPRQSDVPPILDYLNGLGVTVETDVIAVVATHWHDDHVRGLSMIWQEARAATFYCSQVLDSQDFRALTARPAVPSKFSSGVSELRTISADVKERRDVGGPAIGHLSASTRLWTGAGPVTAVWALSPGHEDVARSLEHLSSLMPSTGASRVPAIPPNDASVVLYLETIYGGVLLGADLEHVSGSRTRGWHAVVDNRSRPIVHALLYKVAHHGARSSHCPEVWEQLIADDVVSVVAPFQLGSVDLPSTEDIQRLLGDSASTFITSGTVGTRPRLSRTVEKTIRETTRRYKPLTTPVGHVQVRVSDDAGWVVRGTESARELIA